LGFRGKIHCECCRYILHFGKDYEVGAETQDFVNNPKISDEGSGFRKNGIYAVFMVTIIVITVHQ